MGDVPVYAARGTSLTSGWIDAYLREIVRRTPERHHWMQ
jgi:hypothetical protein